MRTPRKKLSRTLHSFADLEGVEYLTAPPVSLPFAPMSQREVKDAQRRAAKNKAEKALSAAIARAERLARIEEALLGVELALIALRKMDEAVPTYMLVSAENLSRVVRGIRATSF